MSLGPDQMVRVSGFGQAMHADGYRVAPTSVQEVHGVFTEARITGRKVVLRGAGRSYGDASIAAEQIVLDISRLKQILSWDRQTGCIEVQGGVTIEQVWRHTLEDGWWPPVVSGTMMPTIAGALAMNIHGKNNPQAGTLGEHVLEMDVVFPTGELLTLKPSDPLFYAVISGFGMLGVITRVVLQLKKLHSGDLRVLPTSCRNWDEQFETFEKFEGVTDYQVSWVDCIGRGSGFGRGLHHAAWYTDETAGRSASLSPKHQDLPDTLLGFIPKSMMWRFLKPFNNRFGMCMINAAKHTASKILGNGRPHPQSLVEFSFLLDFVPNWRRAYEPGGFIQYQSFVPRMSAPEVFARQVELQQEAKLESFLGVLKRHRPDPFLFSHAVNGYSLALDFKVTASNRERVWQLAHRMNDLVLEAGGRFYLAKDSTLRPSDLQDYMGESALTAYREWKTKCDPEGLLTSDLAIRLHL